MKIHAGRGLMWGIMGNQALEPPACTYAISLPFVGNLAVHGKGGGWEGLFFLWDCGINCLLCVYILIGTHHTMSVVEFSTYDAMLVLFQI